MWIISPVFNITMDYDVSDPFKFIVLLQSSSLMSTTLVVVPSLLTLS